MMEQVAWQDSEFPVTESIQAGMNLCVSDVMVGIPTLNEKLNERSTKSSMK